MSLTEGLLIVAVVILTILVLRGSRKTPQQSRVRSWDCVDRDSGEVTSVKMKYTGPHGHGCACPVCSNPEANAIKENAEHFSGCSNDTAAKAALDCLCADGGDFEYATNDFGGADMDFQVGGVGIFLVLFRVGMNGHGGVVVFGCGGEGG